MMSNPNWKPPQTLTQMCEEAIANVCWRCESLPHPLDRKTAQKKACVCVGHCGDQFCNGERPAGYEEAFAEPWPFPDLHVNEWGDPYDG